MNGEELKRSKIVLLSAGDNVAVALVPIQKGDILENSGKND